MTEFIYLLAKLIDGSCKVTGQTEDTNTRTKGSGQGIHVVAKPTGPVCIHAKTCGRSVVIEHNGDVYACDHCVYPDYKLGNIKTDKLSDMVERSQRSGFGITKETALPRRCRECKVLAACQGGCPKHRFSMTYYNEPGLHYLCEGYKKFFLHIQKYLRAIAQLLENGLSASYIMDAVKGPLVIKLDEK